MVGIGYVCLYVCYVRENKGGNLENHVIHILHKRDFNIVCHNQKDNIET